MTSDFVTRQQVLCEGRLLARVPNPNDLRQGHGVFVATSTSKSVAALRRFPAMVRSSVVKRGVRSANCSRRWQTPLRFFASLRIVSEGLWPPLSGPKMEILLRE